ncbi:unnamed protein product [Adineta steineri]|uniref:Uncharacterized protein n=2 Tax=Adineta steineri TaxID=433720 RepID=A0A819NTP2_9BILA|nr:unnamed protein product [Adineta steineri]
METEEKMCGPYTEILCVKDVLTEIRNASKDIHELANKIERIIYERDPNKVSLENYINHQLTTLRLTFPISINHEQFFQLNNIDRSDLVHLMKEEYNAVRYLFKSIMNLQNAQSISKGEHDGLFDDVQKLFREKILCNYRSILRVYGENGSPIKDIHGIEVKRIQKRQVASFVYNTYSIITVRLLRQWMDSIENIIENLTNKLL